MLLSVLNTGCALFRSNRPDPADAGPVITDIHVIGAENVRPSDILDGLATRKTGVWPWSDPQRLDPLVLETDVQRIESFYEHRGFFDARVVRTREVPDGRDRVRLEITIEEGLPTRIREFEVEGLDGVSERSRKRVLKDLPMGAGAVLEADAYERTRNILVIRLHEEGYPLAEVDGSVDVFPKSQSAVVRIQVTPGDLYLVGPLQIEGLSTYPAEPVKAVAERILAPGSTWRPSLMAEAESRLYDLASFGGVRVGLPAEPPDDPLRTPVQLTLDELPVHAITVGGGVGVERNLQQLQLRADYRQLNFFGGLRRLDWRNELALRFLPSFFAPDRIGLGGTSVLELTQPEVLPRTDAALRVGYERIFRQAYEADAFVARIGLPIHYRRRSNVLPSIGVQRYYGAVGRTPIGPTSLPLSPQCPDPCRVVTLGTTLVHDRRNDQLSPTRGWMLLTDLGWSTRFLGSRFDLFRVEPEVRYFQDVGGGLVLAARARVGAVFALGSTSEVPIVQRLFGGGEGGHRGFGAEQLSPIYQDTNDSFIPLGGAGSWLTSLEFRVRLSESWGAVLFVDYGDVTVSPFDFDVGSAHTALGIGGRYHTLAGPVRLDLAYRIDRKPRVALDTGASADGGILGFFSLFVSLGEAF